MNRLTGCLFGYCLTDTLQFCVKSQLSLNLLQGVLEGASERAGRNEKDAHL